MLFPAAEWLSLSLVSCLGIFLFFDEEPLFDPTDWNIVHVLLLLTCLWVVTWENVVRARYGQFVYKDQVLLYSTFSFWFALENYSRLIVIVFCLHCLTPLELELIELVEVYHSLQAWYTTNLLPTLILVTLAMLLASVANFLANWQSSRQMLLLVTAVTLFLVVNVLITLADFLSASISGFLFNSNPQQSYLQTKGSLSYNMAHMLEDSYDWHISQPQSFVLRFEDLYLFYLQLFNIVALYSCCLVWLFSLQDIVLSNRSSCIVSQSFLGVCTRWLDHALWCFIYSHIVVCGVGFRVWLRVSVELGIWVV